MRKSWLIFMFVAALAYVSPVDAGSVYRWTDDRGRVNFSDQPQEGRTVQKVQIELDSVPAGSDSTASQAKPTEEKSEPLMQADADGQQREIRKKNCELARDALSHNEGLTRMYKLDSNGERVYLSDEERAQVLQTSREDVKAWCD